MSKPFDPMFHKLIHMHNSNALLNYLNTGDWHSTFKFFNEESLNSLLWRIGPERNDCRDDIKYFVDESSRNALYLVGMSYSLEVVNKLIDMGVEMNHRDAFGYSPMIQAINNPDINVVKLYLKHINGNHKTLLAWAAHTNSVDVVKEVLEHRERLNIDIDAHPPGELSALGWGIWNCNYDIVKQLLDAGANPNNNRWSLVWKSPIQFAKKLYKRCVDNKRNSRKLILDLLMS